MKRLSFYNNPKLADFKVASSAMNLKCYCQIKMKKLFKEFTEDILGLIGEESDSDDDVDKLMSLILDIRKNAKQKKDFSTSDQIRDSLSNFGFQIKDEKEGTSWSKQ